MGAAPARDERAPSPSPATNGYHAPVTTAYDDALEKLHAAPFEAFVNERDRLAAELAKQGEAKSASDLKKHRRPPVSAWVVNQLYFKERAAFDALLATADWLRHGEPDPAASTAYREALGELRERAAALLAEAGKPASEATLRRATTTLTALGAAGGFDPDPPGALKTDRDPPGFDVAGLSVGAPSKPRGAAPANAETAARRKQEVEAERRRLEQERAQARAERERVERRLRLARGELEARTQELSDARRQAAAAEQAAETARGGVEALEAELEKLGDPPA